MNRREFLRQSAVVAAGATLARHAPAASSARPPRVALLADPSDAVAQAKPAQWAAGELQRALANAGLSARVCHRPDEIDPADRRIVIAGAGSTYARDAGVALPAVPESLAVAPGKLGTRDALFVLGRDPRGLVYALTDLADAVALGDDPLAALTPAAAVVEQPANRVRSVMRMFSSDVEDKAWFNDPNFWRGYFSLLVAQRFNRVNFSVGLGYDQPIGLRDTYFYFAYPFLLSVPGYNVRATNLPDAERDHNFEMLRWVSDEAAAHGLDFQLGVWTHAFQWHDSPNANHVIEGLTPQTQAPYCRDALALILKECPNITGVTLRIHGESGVPEGSYGLWQTIFEACTRGGRPVPLDLHAKGMDEGTLKAALSVGVPLTVSPKYWAEHMGLPYHQAAIRPTELPREKKKEGMFAHSEGDRSFTRYGYGDFLREDRLYSVVFRMWPGTQRVLLWGDPLFAAAYSRRSSFLGADGCELFDPLSFKGRKGSGLPGTRDGYTPDSVHAPGPDFEKFRLTHRLWGRLLYNPDTPPAVWERQLRADYGAAAKPAGVSLAHASRLLPLFTTAHCPSAANNLFWPEMYANMAIVDEPAERMPYFDTLSPRRFGFVSPLDPELFSRIVDFADELLAGKVGAKYSPVEVAQWLEDLAQAAAFNLSAAENKAFDHRTATFRRFAVDANVAIGLGRFYARKLRAAVLFALHERTGDKDALAAAIQHYHLARDEWKRVATLTTDVYVKDVTYGPEWYQRGHWTDRLAAIEQDIAAMEKRTDTTPPSATPVAAVTIARLINQATGRPERPTAKVKHVAPAAFTRGAAVELAISVAPPRTANLHYRHTHQAQPWNATPMTRGGDTLHAAIPADYTDTVYPLEYYFEIAEPSGAAWLHPGLGPDLDQQPYFAVRSAQRA
ncbi:MAG TPA: hypothetical protein VHE13_00120 [Opitutus sp.]|nr:hypothetical protein [Opitutus sp.]